MRRRRQCIICCRGTRPANSALTQQCRFFRFEGAVRFSALTPKPGTDFWLLSAGIVSLRAADLAITYAVSPDLRWEINPLVSVAGLGWLALLTSNIAGVTLILVLLYFSQANTTELYPAEPGYSVKEFVSHYLFGERHAFRKIYYVVPKNRRAIIEYCGYVFARVVMVWSFIVVLNNALVWYSPGFRHAMADLRLWLAVYGLLICLTIAYSLRFFTTLYRKYVAAHA